MADHDDRAVTAAIITVLTAAGLTVGDGKKPDGGGWQGVEGQSVFTPYVVVEPVAGGVTDGSLDDPDEDASPIYLLWAWGRDREQCQWAQAAARTAIKTTPLAIAGRSVIRVRIDTLGGARRIDTIQPPLWQSDERYRIDTTPS